MTDLHAEIEGLRRENSRLRRLMRLTEAGVAPAAGTQSAWLRPGAGTR